ncbi:MAG: hypothetical protein ACR2O0_00630 [Rhizobiaceae bacterium]
MKLNRRQVIASALAAGVSSSFTRSATAMTKSADELKKQLEMLGLSGSEPASIVVPGSEFNGGLRYDESHVSVPRGTYLLQPCARIGDIAEKGRTGVLPLFHIARVDWQEGTSAEDGLAKSLTLLTNGFGLDSNRLAVVGIPILDTYRAGFEAAGIPESRIFRRPLEEAKAAGDGSGIFRHPEDGKIEFATAAVYFSMAENPSDEISSYPLSENWLEIGEIALDQSIPLGAGFGVERLLFALGGTLPEWDTQKNLLLEMIDREADDNIPPGKMLFQKS